jgi:hypothetical protein
MRETETLLMSADVMETYRDASKLNLQFSSEQIMHQGSNQEVAITDQNISMIKNPYKNIINQQSTGIIKAPIYIK